MVSDQTGEYSVYTQYKNREIMFHVSTLLPYDQSDSQHVCIHMLYVLISVPLFVPLIDVWYVHRHGEGNAHCVDTH